MRSDMTAQQQNRIREHDAPIIVLHESSNHLPHPRNFVHQLQDSEYGQGARTRGLVPAGDFTEIHEIE